ncbi:hypothetical protein Poli38472_009003 [Pythium oligandrum]|uniref:Uncharacterized protein n=1 Tax=Pythium oligandrum TaxID=41045 RepID=A0A8K1CJM5_PYTOL|nr:hypothetical protein Poli38472_009003 [Pythium oligandrum]|eukprot:TMW64836.1 hypothetical protein Poli38472_009003 [Pythium oligandrum]
MASKAPGPAPNGEVSPVQLSPGITTRIEQLSRVPREFFILETNAVLPQTQYPPTQYQSTFSTASSSWETVVFPALTPQTRQQVLLLAQTLARLRAARLPAGFDPSVMMKKSALEAKDALAVVEYTEHEWELYSIGFHELARQIKFICKEQSELLQEVQQHYDSAMTRLIGVVRGLYHRHEQHEQQVEAMKQQVLQLEEDAKRSKEESDRLANAPRGPPIRRPGRGRKSPSDTDYSERQDDEEYEQDGEDKEGATLRRYVRQRPRDGDAARRLYPRASVMEENLAAARVQHMYQKYQLRKEQLRVAMREQKKMAALEIQRSYRGYQDRKRFAHRRAVMQLILRRRKQMAAVELLQTNVRTYLLKKRREDKLIQEQIAQFIPQTVLMPTVGEASGERKDQAEQLDEAAAGGDQNETVESSTASTEQDPNNPEANTFVQLLGRMSELTAAFAVIQARRKSPQEQGDCTDEFPSTIEEESDVISPGTPNQRSRPATAPSVAPECEEELHSTIRQAEDLVQSFRAAIVDFKRRGAVRLAPGGGTLDPYDENELNKSTSTTSLAPMDRERDAMHEFGLRFLFVEDDDDKYHERRLTVSRRKTLTGISSSDNDQGLTSDMDDTHLDDVLWQTTVYSPRSLVDDDEANARRMLLREVFSSREQKKRHTGLKQFIVDIYDTIVGRIRDLPASRLALLLRSHCSLALSSVDAHRYLKRRRHYRSNQLSQQHNDSVSLYEPAEAIVKTELRSLIREHYHCQVGLKHLVDASITQLEVDLRAFQQLDPDVKRFYDFLTHERSYEELVFYCVCRFFASQSAPSTPREPVFHPVTMRELVSQTRALEIAKTLFHVDDEAKILEGDAFVIEPTNEVYRCHLPSSCFQQCETIVKDYFGPVESDPLRDDNDEESRVPPASTTGMLRSSNANQFHAREFNASAARSPLVRRARKPGAVGSGWGHLSPESETEWLYLDEFVDLLRRYRAIMTHFHAFVQWIHELFLKAVQKQGEQRGSRLTDTSTSSPVLEESMFVETLLPFSLGASERELENVFHNALRQRQLRSFMPLRVFVSVVLVLLRNGVLSVNSYSPIQPQHADKSAKRASIREQTEETRWRQLALQWRGLEQRFEGAIELIYASTATDPAVNNNNAMQLLQWRSELYEHFVKRSGPEPLEHAQELYEQLRDAIFTVERGGSLPSSIEPVEPTQTLAVGSPWDVTPDESGWSSSLDNVAML